MTFLDSLTEKFEKDLNEIIDFSVSAYKRYRRFEIKKRTGGTRSIHHPSKELKSYQRFISREIFKKLPVHESVFSYLKNTSIKDLANLHKKNRYLLRLDFKDFFPSIKGENIRLFLNNTNLDLSDLEITLINLLVCKKDKLTIGAPSSPSITNAILFEFDKEIYEMCLERNINYSRYADDLYFSTNEENQLSSILEYIYKYTFPYEINLQINNKKNIFTSKKYKRLITGLTITTDNNVSVGRKQKRYVKSLINSHKYGLLDTKELQYLKGYLNFLSYIEPNYILLLKNKYGKNIIDKLFINDYLNKKDNGI